MISRTNERKALFQCGGFSDMQIEWNHLLLTEPKKNQRWAAKFGIFMFVANLIQFLS